ncbi:MAG: hypothetical protein QOG38_123, partial [Hyphomicrobiales bacterium]|nr:hypothetical protein [Hyphomicrobiales bacterium]
MSRTNPGVAHAALAVLALASLMLVVPSASAQGTSAITEFSSQPVDPKKLRGGAPRGTTVAPRINVAPRVNIAPRV